MLSYAVRQGLQVEIDDVQEGQPLKTLQEEHHKPGKGKEGRSECFLECHEGTEFAIRIKRLPSCSYKGPWGIDIYIDGKMVDRPVMDIGVEEIVRDSMYETEGDVIYRKPFKFSAILQGNVINDEDGGVNAAPEMGTIEVVFKKGKIDSSSLRPPEAFDLNTDVPDKHLAKLGVTVGTGEREEYNINHRMCVFTPLRQSPIFYRFIFKYRTTVRLVLMRIVAEDAPIEIPGPSRKRPIPPDPVGSSRTQDRDDDLDEPPSSIPCSAEQEMQAQLQKVRVENDRKAKRLRTIRAMTSIAPDPIEVEE